MATDLVTRIRGRSVQATDLITRIRGRASSSLTVNPGSGRTLEPGDTVTLAASASVLPDTWLWEQTDGYAVTLDGTGQSRTFTAPPTPDGTTLTFQITASKDGATPAVGTVSFPVYPHTMWRLVGTDIGPVVLTV